MKPNSRYSQVDRLNRVILNIRMAMDWQERIIVDPEILIEKPFIKGKRLAVEFTVILLGQG